MISLSPAKVKTPNSILVIAVPGIGDAFLVTPLLSSLKKAYPNCEIDVIVRTGSEGLIKNNSDIRNIISFPRRPKINEYWNLTKRIFRKYDLALSTSYTDRAMNILLLASSRRISVVPKKNFQSIWKYLLTAKQITHDENLHTVLQNLKISDALNIARDYKLKIPLPENKNKLLIGLLKKLNKPFVLMHIFPSSNYKSWPLKQWFAIIDYLERKNLLVILTGIGTKEELQIVAELEKQFPNTIRSAVGIAEFSDIAMLCDQAKAFIGIDTSTTHLAAATGIKTFVIFGPSNFMRWAPWPYNYTENQNPFENKIGIQEVSNIVLLQGDCQCKPFNKQCSVNKEHKQSVCLDKLEAKMLITSLDRYFNSLLEHNH